MGGLNPGQIARRAQHLLRRNSLRTSCVNVMREASKIVLLVLAERIVPNAALERSQFVPAERQSLRCSQVSLVRPVNGSAMYL